MTGRYVDGLEQSPLLFLDDMEEDNRLVLI